MPVEADHSDAGSVDACRVLTYRYNGRHNGALTDPPNLLTMLISGVNPGFRKGGCLGNLTGKMQRGWRQTQRIFHFLVGLAFMCLAGVGISVSMEAWRTHLSHPSVSLFRCFLFAGFTILLIFLCLFSFLKARSVR